MTTPPSPPSHRGIANIGNTCYLNSAIQALRHTPAFTRYFCSDAWKTHSSDRRPGAELTKETASVVAELAGAGADARTLVPSKFVRSFVAAAHEINDEIHFGAQCDVAEAIHILLDMLHTHLAREVLMNIRGEARSPAMSEYVKSLESWIAFFHKEYSPLLDMFYGQTRTRVVCERCLATSDRYEPWNVLSLPIPGAEKAGAPAPTLQECLAGRFADEKLEDYECSRCCDKVPAKIEHTLSRFPQYLILSLKRFTNAGNKVRARIPYDDATVELSDWRAWKELQTPESAQYRVYATIEHLGSSRMGHYIMRARNGDGWLIYDDASVHPSPIGGAAGPDTYVLFLERKDSPK
jgi:ubiquitin C-terminal hydrolase